MPLAHMVPVSLASIVTGVSYTAARLVELPVPRLVWLALFVFVALSTTRARVRHELHHLRGAPPHPSSKADHQSAA